MEQGDTGLYQELEDAIREVFPGESDRVRLAAVEAWGVVMNRVPESGLEGCAWCLHFDRAIDYRLVKIDRPPCIEERNGCRTTNPFVPCALSLFRPIFPTGIVLIGCRGDRRL